MDIRSDIPAVPPADLEAQARAWIVRLRSGVATEADLDGLAAWRAGSPDAEAAFDQARRLWTALGPALEEDVRSRVIPLRHTAMPRRAVIGAGAGAVAAAAVGAVYLGGRRSAGREGVSLVATGKGEQRRLEIGEGAVAELNTASEARLWQAGGLKGMDLLKGEAVVTLAQTQAEVVARVGRAAVSSTDGQFLLRAEGAVSRILCLRGQAFVSADNQRLALAPWDILTLDDGGLHRSRERQEDEPAAWRLGRLIYQDRHLADVVDELNRYRPGRIVVRGDALRRRRVSGVVQLDRIDGALANIARSLDVRVTRLPGDVIILG